MSYQEVALTRLITTELAAVVKVAVKDYENRADSSEPVPSDIVLSICNVIEAIFIHGLKDAYFLKGSRYAKYPEPNFWPFIQQFLPRNVRSQISQMKMIKNDVGKSRSWIRLALNEAVMESYVSAFNREKSSVRRYYKRTAFLRDNESVEILINQMSGLSRLFFKAPVNSSMLNCWTPTPLTIAGYLNQKTCNNLTNYSGIPEMEEIIGRKDDIPIGESALDFDGIGDESASEANISSTNSYGPIAPASICGSTLFSVDDRSSIASKDDSHPSLVDSTFRDDENASAISTTVTGISTSEHLILL